MRLVAGAIVIIAAVAVAILTYSPKEASPQQKCGEYRTDRTLQIGSEQIKAEVANNPAEKEKGLGGRPCIEPDRGMLFVYETAQQYAIWMKDMKFPIDIVWLGPDKKVVAIEKRVDPSTYPDGFTNEKSRPAQYVLELKSGRAEELGINIGTQVNN